MAGNIIAFCYIMPDGTVKNHNYKDVATARHFIEEEGFISPTYRMLSDGTVEEVHTCYDGAKAVIHRQWERVDCFRMPGIGDYVDDLRNAWESLRGRMIVEGMKENGRWTSEFIEEMDFIWGDDDMGVNGMTARIDKAEYSALIEGSEKKGGE